MMEEMIDVLDENGVKTGEVVTRKEVHKKGLWHRVVVVTIIDNSNQILMQQRSYQKDLEPGKWDVSAAGHISSGESSVEAAIKEVHEELGIEVSSNNLVFFLTYQDVKLIREDYIEKQIYDCYVLRIKEINREDITIQNSEVENVKLVNKEDFQDMVAHENMVKRDDMYSKLIEYLFKN